MAEQEVNAINHLLEVEQNAKAMTDSAKITADKKISAAKTQADEKFKAEFDKIVASDEKAYDEKIKAANAQEQKKIQEYKDKIKSSKVDVDSFNKFLDKVLA